MFPKRNKTFLLSPAAWNLNVAGGFTLSGQFLSQSTHIGGACFSCIFHALNTGTWPTLLAAAQTPTGPPRRRVNGAAASEAGRTLREDAVVLPKIDLCLLKQMRCNITSFFTLSGRRSGLSYHRDLLDSPLPPQVVMRGLFLMERRRKAARGQKDARLNGSWPLTQFDRTPGLIYGAHYFTV